VLKNTALITLPQGDQAVQKLAEAAKIIELVEQPPQQ
jgi:hypothetical protein